MDEDVIIQVLNMRWVERDGEKVLQMYCEVEKSRWGHGTYREKEWLDVPIVEEE